MKQSKHFSNPVFFKQFEERRSARLLLVCISYKPSRNSTRYEGVLIAFVFLRLFRV